MKVLLPVDGSESALEAVRYVLRLFHQGLKLDVVLANVQEPPNLYELVVVHDPELIHRASAQAGLHALQAAKQMLDAAGLVCEREVAKGDPAHTIVEIAERFECALIVMGARGASSVRSALLGSVAHEVLHASTVPVLIVKPQESELTEVPEA